VRLVIFDFESIHVTAGSLGESPNVVFVAVVKTFIEADIENILMSKVRTLRRARDILFGVRVYYYLN
jgi:hypothetical protein